MSLSVKDISETETDVYFEGNEKSTSSRAIPVCVTKSRASSESKAVLLTHGAGGDMNMPHLTAVAKAVASAGFLCVRFTCKPPAMQHRLKAYRTVLNWTRSCYPQLKYVIVAGRSMGARVAAALACEPDMSDFISGCIFLSYPLYCPSKPLALRKEHLLPLAVPSLFLSGDSDEMCDKKVLTEVAAKMATQPAIYWVAGANHGMSVKGRKRIDIEEEMCGCVVKWVTKEFRRLSKRSVEESRDSVGAAPSVENSPIKLAFERARKCKKHPRQKSSEEASKKHRNT